MYQATLEMLSRTELVDLLSLKNKKLSALEKMLVEQTNITNELIKIKTI